LKLNDILKGVSFSGEFSAEAEAANITCVSSDCNPDTLFFAFKGEKRDGIEFIPDAVSKGCRFVVVQKGACVNNSDHNYTIISVDNGREAMAIAASNFASGAENSLKLCGITGTSGKTTVSYLIDSIMREEKPSTIIGTIKHIIHGTLVDSANTTPESFTIHSLLANAVKVGAKHAVLEVSSHSLKLKRVHALNFDAAVFTNISRDHLDFHGTEADYIASKLILFKDRLKSTGVAVINVDDPHAVEFIKASAAGVVTYGVNSKVALVRPCTIEAHAKGMIINMTTPVGPITVRTDLRAHFNVYNVLAAVATAIGLGYKEDSIVKGIERLKAVEGRFESVNVNQPFAVIVDYAHKPDALVNVLQAAREITKGRLICLFGCGGDRDKGKRPVMGEISERLSDFTILTSDNPRTEEPSTILSEIKSGMKDSRKFVVIEDRRAAINAAVKMAAKDDCVVIAGKGHETYQIVGKVKHHFDDREEVEIAIKEIYGNKN
jgi:UDP-N-acetylmuramoyl-L-alanyl-D-glutamate--2,6-diaminopimelate ligase